ncbi:hypothetical protein Vadar_018010 [Vaccinium darrowii]|uniref:Uncharacterized protein n=1 Tax=Vaccinium darrowii TaxID=229202 RepID=A0ACB7X223_9ERIC|nr:hypothetical protein Vadar_018010 [Vaccinium darrowii]
MAALTGKMEGEVEIKSNGDDIFPMCADGKVETYKDRVSIDEENKTVDLIALERHLLEVYKSYNIIYQFHNGETNIVKITIEYEKKNEDVPPPQKYVDFIISLIKDLDAKLINEYRKVAIDQLYGRLQHTYINNGCGFSFLFFYRICN